MRSEFVRLLIVIGSFFVWLPGFCQSENTAGYQFQIAAGRTVFGTGDVPALGIMIEGSKNINKTSRTLVNKLLAGIELSFQSGSKTPVVVNPTPEEFFRTTFNHSTLTSINAKLTYYPFKRILNGFHLSAAPSLAYMVRSFEGRADRAVYGPDVVRRMSELKFSKKFLPGYVLSAGYDIEVAKRWFTGLRIDLANYKNNDLNSFIGAKVGVLF